MFCQFTRKKQFAIHLRFLLAQKVQTQRSIFAQIIQYGLSVNLNVRIQQPINLSVLKFKPCHKANPPIKIIYNLSVIVYCVLNNDDFCKHPYWRIAKGVRVFSLSDPVRAYSHSTRPAVMMAME